MLNRVMLRTAHMDMALESPERTQCLASQNHVHISLHYVRPTPSAAIDLAVRYHPADLRLAGLSGTS
jgi:hypothetical protein